MITDDNVRPWGRYDILDEGPTFKAKRITVNPSGRLSYQRHKRRAEHWIIVEGEATVTLDDEILVRVAGETIEIPVLAKHRVENRGSVPLVFVEVQVGDYFGEDDIERFSDDYGRV